MLRPSDSPQTLEQEERTASAEPLPAMAKRPRKPARTCVTKLFVLDTNVLRHDPASLFRLEVDDVYLPLGTLVVLDSN